MYFAGACLVAGDFDCRLGGVYGENDIRSDGSGNNSELIPLLKQLIQMLEAGVPFQLSPELLNLLQVQAPYLHFSPHKLESRTKFHILILTIFFLEILTMMLTQTKESFRRPPVYYGFTGICAVIYSL